MTKVPQAGRKSTVAAGVIGLATIGAVAGAVPAHAADTSSGPVTANLAGVKNILGHGADSTQFLSRIPVLGGLLQNSLASGGLPMLAAAPSQPTTRSVPTSPFTAQSPSPYVTQSSSPYVTQSTVVDQADSGSPLSPARVAALLPDKVPVARLDRNSLPLGGGTHTSPFSLPVIGDATNAGALLGTLL